MSFYRNQLEEWLSNITVKTERVLDIGGAANPVRKRIKSMITGDYVIMDNGIEEPKTDFISFDLNEPWENQLIGYQKADIEFGAVFCLEVFEYIWNPVQAIENIYNLMNKDSVCYVSFPAIYPVHQPVEFDSLRYTKAAIMRYFSLPHLLFKDVEITPRIATQGRPLLSGFYSEEGMHPVRKSELPYDIGYLVKARKLLY